MKQTEANPLMTIETGKVAGTYEVGGEIAVFKGAPYAHPPVGARRWQAPQPPESWTGVRSAEKYSPRAMQMAAGFDKFMGLYIGSQGWSWFAREAVKLLIRTFSQGDHAKPG